MQCFEWQYTKRVIVRSKIYILETTCVSDGNKIHILYHITAAILINYLPLSYCFIIYSFWFVGWHVPLTGWIFVMMFGSSYVRTSTSLCEMIFINLTGINLWWAYPLNAQLNHITICASHSFLVGEIVRTILKRYVLWSYRSRILI